MHRRQLLGIPFAIPFAAGMLAAGAVYGDSRLTRVVVIGGALAECVYALGAQDWLVGADTTCTYPAATASLPKVGYQRSLSTEGILSLRPSLVLASQEAGPPTVFTQLRDAGIRVVSVDGRNDVDTARCKLSVTGDALGVTSRAAPLLQQFDAQWQMTVAHVASRVGQRRPLRVLFILGHSGMQSMVAGKHTAADASDHGSHRRFAAASSASLRRASWSAG